MKIPIPLPCPKCRGKMQVISYDTILKILSPRSWHSCTECSYTEDTEKFKRRLLTV